MKFVNLLMPVLFLGLTAWLAWLGNGYWGWPLVMSFLLSASLTNTIKSKDEDEDEDLLKKIKSNFKKEDNEKS
jgi:hypothetical protein